jgi:hypothetical protein
MRTRTYLFPGTRHGWRADAPITSTSTRTPVVTTDGGVHEVSKETRNSRRRMPGYQRPGPTQRTNIACHAKLMEVLTVKETVDIYVFRDPEPKLHAGVPINLAAGLEDGLILEFRPPWNKAGL